jgi:nucleolar MIF4G domain-containing protein 1
LSEETQELEQIAREQRINTDLKKAIFYTIMNSEDYIDAFEKLNKLNLTAQQVSLYSLN